MIRRELPDDIIERTDASSGEVIELLKKFNVGEYFEEVFSSKDLRDTSLMSGYLMTLKQEGLDIGKGDCEFGYKFKMSLPKKMG